MAEAGKESTDGMQADAELLKQFECPVCLRLLHDPATLHCGHSLCRRCLSTCLRHALKCPQCRVDVPPEAALPSTSVALQQAIWHMLPVESRQRADEERLVVESPLTTCQQLSLFYLEPLLPKQRMVLHIFEPRYITMMERVLASADPMFGMLVHRARHGTAARIIEHSRLQGGRFLMTVEGQQRFKVLRTYEVDGYSSAQVVWATDNTLSAEGTLEACLLGAEVTSLVNEWTGLVRTGGWERSLGQLDVLLSELGPTPPLFEPEALGLWVAACVNPLPPLGVAPELRVAALEQVDSVARLRVVLNGLELSIRHLRAPSLGQSIMATACELARALRSAMAGRLALVVLFVSCGLAAVVVVDDYLAQMPPLWRTW
jgi:hypothetical protein